MLSSKSSASGMYIVGHATAPRAMATHKPIVDIQQAAEAPLPESVI
jgi:hypothetical protein